jgi:hypothetical protein
MGRRARAVLDDALDLESALAWVLITLVGVILALGAYITYLGRQRKPAEERLRALLDAPREWKIRRYGGRVVLYCDSSGCHDRRVSANLSTRSALIVACSAESYSTGSGA